jgi:hypothetical protein
MMEDLRAEVMRREQLLSAGEAFRSTSVKTCNMIEVQL